MKEAIGNSFLVTMAITFLFLIMAILVASFTFSKAYKAKNNIINIIEKYGNFSYGEDNDANYARSEIYQYLETIGYPIAPAGRVCPDYTVGGAETLKVAQAWNGEYDFCTYEVNTSRGRYYHVIVYTHFDIPIVGQFLNFPIAGDTRTIYSNNFDK